MTVVKKFTIFFCNFLKIPRKNVRERNLISQQNVTKFHSTQVISLINKLL